MKTVFIEAEHSDITFNYGKFCVARFEPEEWSRESQIDEGRKLLHSRGWSNNHLYITDLQTGEGSFFLPGGMASADLNKHKIWVCPMFEPFLNWLYKQDLTDLDKLPKVVKFTQEEAPPSMVGYRREGK